MNNNQKRLFAFLLGCIPVRIFLSYLAYTLPPSYLQIMGYVTLIPAFGFLIIYLFGLRQTGAETYGNKIWWNNLRPIHFILYFVFSILAINKNNKAWIALAIDVSIGLVSFLLYHFLINQDFLH